MLYASRIIIHASNQWTLNKWWQSGNIHTIVIFSFRACILHSCRATHNSFVHNAFARVSNFRQRHACVSQEEPLAYELRKWAQRRSFVFKKKFSVLMHYVRNYSSVLSLTIDHTCLNKSMLPIVITSKNTVLATHNARATRVTLIAGYSTSSTCMFATRNINRVTSGCFTASEEKPPCRVGGNVCSTYSSWRWQWEFGGRFRIWRRTKFRGVGCKELSSGTSILPKGPFKSLAVCAL